MTTTTTLSEIERQIIDKLVDDILAARRSISVHDGGAFPLRLSRDKAAIMAEIGASDETRLFIHFEGDKAVEGWVQLIHGNDVDVISDNTDKASINALLKGAEALAEKFDDRGR